MEDKKLDNAIKYLTKDYEESDTTSAFMLCTRWALVDALELLKEYQQIVRCKDCIHYRYYDLDSYPVSECKIDHEENPEENWFCADGELEK